MANFRPAEVAHGPMLLGFAFNAILYGVMILQTHVYFATNSKYLLFPLIFKLLIPAQRSPMDAPIRTSQHRLCGRR